VRIAAVPHPFPRREVLTPANAAIFAIDMQRDFLEPDGYIHRLGCDLRGLRAAIEPVRRVLATARARGFRVVHTREGYRDDLSDLQPWKRPRHPNEAVAIGERGPLGRALIRGEPGWNFVPELRPEPGERVFDKPGYGVFAFTDLDATLRSWGVENVVLTGVTTDCCVHSVLREALDRGYDCLVLEDCVGASSPGYHEAAMSLVRKTSGVFGAATTSPVFIDAITEDISASP
jgi:nicotinamidase-related amidase